MLRVKIKEFKAQIDSKEFKSFILSKFKDRKVELNAPCSRNVVFTSYFTTQVDPQRKIRHNANSFDYIETWYTSIIKNNSYGIIFHDDCSVNFIKRYANKNVQFVKCVLGEYSLNDERFILFSIYLANFYNQLDYVLITDINDVTFNNNPFKWLVKFKEDQILLGRNNTNRFIDSDYNLKRLMNLEKAINLRLPNEFFLFPVYNAGVTGGNKTIILYFLLFLTERISLFSNVYNNNMISYNYVIYNDFHHPISYSSVYKLTRLLPRSLFLKVYRFLVKRLIRNKGTVRHKKDKIAITKNILTSSPFLNPYKSFNVSKKYYIIHK